MKSNEEQLGRRGFLKATAGAAAGLTIVPSGSAFGTEANSRVNIGITGCGHRGEFVGGLFEENTSARVVALHDYFEDRVNVLGEKFRVAPARRYVGLDGYLELMTEDVDVVAVMSPPYFHPEQSVAALRAGKHLYLSKPIAVDVPGCKKILQECRRARGKLSILVDFQTRADPLFREAVRRVRSGGIGAPVLGHVYYQAGRLSPRDKSSGPTARLRNWVFDRSLSGDIIVEQNIHVIDVTNWYLDSHPLKASGTGGRKARTDVGDCWDHFVVTFGYPNGVLVDFSSGQYLKGYSDLCIRIYGSEGTVDSHYNGTVSITGDHPWEGGDTKGLYRSGTVNNIKAYYDSLIDSKPLYQTIEDSAMSNLSAILGRMAAFEEREVTWEEMMSSAVGYDPWLNLPEDGPRIGPQL